MADATTLIDDPRARYFWDGSRRVGGLFRTFHLGDETFHLDDAAWDTYMLFDRDARWQAGSAPPEPAWWEHQLWGLPQARHLDARRFAREAAALSATG